MLVGRNYPCDLMAFCPISSGQNPYRNCPARLELPSTMYSGGICGAAIGQKRWFRSQFAEVFPKYCPEESVDARPCRQHRQRLIFPNFQVSRQNHWRRMPLQLLGWSGRLQCFPVSPQACQSTACPTGGRLQVMHWAGLTGSSEPDSVHSPQ